jgi:hypothetical protein
MIFALGEDGELSVFEDLPALRACCEGIDVESGVWDFFDHAGQPLQPTFSKPNKVKKVLGLFSIVQSGEFEFLPVTDGSEPTLLQSLTEGVYLGQNSRFGSLQEVREYLGSGVRT